MSSADGEFRDFVAGFAEPLTRLTGLLVATDPSDVEATHRSVVAALARTKRDWRDESAAPEQHSVDAVLSRLPCARLPAARPPDAAPAVDFPDDEPETRAIKSAVWRAWCELDPRHRVPLLFADPTVASRRVDGIELPRSFAAGRKLDRLRTESDERLRFALARDDAIHQDVDDVIEGWLAPTLADVAARFEAPTDVWSQVDAAVGRLRWKTGAAAAAVVAVLVGGWIAASGASQPERPAAVVSSSTAIGRPAGPSLDFSADRVVNWPTRGNLSDDSQFLARVRTAFIAAHPEALAQVQVLLAADTTWFRLAYATSPSPDGAIGAWFYGPVGSQALTEGAFRHGADVPQGGVIAAALSDPSGATVLVVIGPPNTTEVQWTNVESLSAPDPPRGVDDLAHSDGVTIHDVSSTYLPAVRLVVHVGRAVPWSGPVPEVQLVTGSVAQIPVERGFADAVVLGAAMGVARQWQRTGVFGSNADPKVVWGGVDDVGDVGVVLRMVTPQLSDLVVVSWLSDHQRTPQSRAYRVDAATSDAPFAFFYTARDGTRVGLIAPHGTSRATLVVDGVETESVFIATTGFASLPVHGQTGLLAEQSITVRLFAASGQPINELVVPLQPLVGGDA